MTTIAIAGATGAVGQQMLECLKERNIQADLKLLASARSKGKEIDGHIVEELTQESFQGVDYVLGATGNDITKMWMPWAKEAGCIVVDNSSAYRLDEDVPLVIPEVNKEDIKNHHGLIANPNCATIIALVALHALHKKYHIKRMIVTTFQAVSGAGVQGIEDLKNQIEDENIPSKAFPYQIAFNLIPQIGDFDDLRHPERMPALRAGGHHRQQPQDRFRLGLSHQSDLHAPRGAYRRSADRSAAGRRPPLGLYRHAIGHSGPGLPRGVPPVAAHGRRARAWGMLSLSYFDEILLFRNIFAIMGKHIV